MYQDRIIGEGYHQLFGGPHAEVNCLASVAEAERPLIPDSDLYVSLEPCSHFGKTPPCTSLIIQHRIRRVYLACRDPFPAVNGKGIAILRSAGVEVMEGIAEAEATAANKRFFTFHRMGRPYLILKWAQSADRCLAGAGPEPVAISGDTTNRLVHRWRSEEAGILIGSGTAMRDNPKLTARLPGAVNPVRIVLDSQLKLPRDLDMFREPGRVFIINAREDGERDGALLIRVGPGEGYLENLMAQLHERQILSILVEGGQQVLQLFLDADLWDELRVITNTGLYLPGGYPAPRLPEVLPVYQEQLLQDRIEYFLNPRGTHLYDRDRDDLKNFLH